ncbi:hypothetical protein [Nitrospirillum amazonense]|uniref:hypothetical protein n=1 Tax=Nitrospirillum amazonense TaxID=28077 RepID=UPI0024126B97|nr:hypothetical protein [Nitrospirillum amazonense]MDG3444512.1 hypothetical protein [Nitrospirillum amazonense]
MSRIRPRTTAQIAAIRAARIRGVPVAPVRRSLALRQQLLEAKTNGVPVPGIPDGRLFQNSHTAQD